MTRLRLAQAAVDDIRELRRYSKARFGVSATRSYVDGLRRLFAALHQQPFMGAVEPGLDPVTRGFAYRSHRIFYRLDDGGIVILRILHHARDASRIMERRP